ncbi:MAG: hypothetical protein WCL04_03385 [Verrucomicrobiota bacterium]
MKPQCITPVRRPAVAARPLRGKKTWREKLADDKDLPKVVTLDAIAAARWGGRTLAIPAPREVDALMRRIPRGRVVTINELRAAVARRHHADVGCPITTGIFPWMAAHAAAEAAAAGETAIAPYWRTLKVKGELNLKYPGGIPALTARLEAEGHAVVQKGKRFFVRDFEKAVAKL